MTSSALAGYGDDRYGDNNYGGIRATVAPTWALQYVDPSGVWQDGICDVRRIRVTAGRSTYVDAFTAATAEIEFYNVSGRYSAATANSIWRQANGYVTGGRVRAGSVYNGTVTWRFVGTVDSIADSWPGLTDAVATVTATDGFKLLARHNGGARTPVGAGEKSGARVNRLLNDAAWAGARAVDVGRVTLQATDLAGVTIDLLRQVGEAEWGWLFVAADGTLTFLQGDAGDNLPNMVTVQFTFTDDDALAGACYGEAQLTADDTHIINTATVTPPGHSPSTFTDAGSAAWFGPRTWTRTDLPFAVDADAAALAQAVVATYASDDLRIDAVTIDAAHRPSTVPAAHGAKITDRVRFVRTYPNGDQLDAELLVQGRTDEVLPDGAGGVAVWNVTLQTAGAALVIGLGAWDVGTWDESLWGV